MCMFELHILLFKKREKVKWYTFDDTFLILESDKLF